MMRIVTAAAVFGLVLSVSAAWATIPDASGVIHACYKVQNGQVRIIDPSEGQSCGPSEAPLQWNQAGQAGSDSTRTAAGAINPDGTSQVATTDFVSSRQGVGQYRIDFAPGVFSTAPDIVVMPIGRRYISGALVTDLGGGAWRIAYFTVNIDSNALEDTLTTFIATPFSH